jgi:elongation factor G
MSKPITLTTLKKTRSSKPIRNIGIAAHIDAGKTTLTERILFLTGAIHSYGEVHDGNTKTDFDPIERQKGITISAAAVSCSWTAKKEEGLRKLFEGTEHDLNIIDTPGHVDFTAEVERSLRVLDGVIAVFCGVGGVQPQSETVWRQADRYAVPRVAFVNKLDRPGADFERVVTDIRHTFRANACAVLMPFGTETVLYGQIDIVNERLLVFRPGRPNGYVIEPLPANLIPSVERWRTELVSTLAEIDDKIAEPWLAGKRVPAELLLAVIRRQTICNRFVPVVGGSAYKFVGIEPLLDAVVQYLPSPVEIALRKTNDESASGEIRCDPSEPLVALAFKLVNDKLAGRFVFVRLYRGILKKEIPCGIRVAINRNASDVC